MQVFAHWSLPAVVLISGFGALVMCALLLRDWYPSSSATNSDAEPSGDAGLTRLGHAFAATCFALIAVIGVIGLVQQGRAVRQAQAEQDGVATKIAEVREEVLGLDKRVASVESRVEGGAESADRLAHRLDDRVAGLERRMTNTQTALRQMSGDVARVQANVKQIERVVAAEAPRSTAARGLAEPPHAAAAATFVAETRIAQLGAVSIALDRAAASIRGARDPGDDLTRRSSGACHRAAVAADEPRGAPRSTIAATARAGLEDEDPRGLGNDQTRRAQRRQRDQGRVPEIPRLDQPVAGCQHRVASASRTVSPRGVSPRR